MKGKLKLKNVEKSTNSQISPNRSALREIILSIRKRDVSVSDKDSGSWDRNRTKEIDLVTWILPSSERSSGASGSLIPSKDDSDIPDTPYSIPDSGFSEFDFGDENENNETPTSELLRKCRIARMESTLAKVRCDITLRFETDSLIG